MTAEQFKKVQYFRDPHLLFVEMVGNPSFTNDFDYMPYREFDANGTQHYQHFMSGNWAWKQAVCSDLYRQRFIVSNFVLLGYNNIAKP